MTTYQDPTTGQWFDHNPVTGLVQQWVPSAQQWVPVAQQPVYAAPVQQYQAPAPVQVAHTGRSVTQRHMGYGEIAGETTKAILTGGLSLIGTASKRRKNRSTTTYN